MPGCDFAGFDPFSGLDGCGNPLVPEDVYVYTAYSGDNESANTVGSSVPSTFTTIVTTTTPVATAPLSPENSIEHELQLRLTIPSLVVCLFGLIGFVCLLASYTRRSQKTHFTFTSWFLSHVLLAQVVQLLTLLLIPVEEIVLRDDNDSTGSRNTISSARQVRQFLYFLSFFATNLFFLAINIGQFLVINKRAKKRFHKPIVLYSMTVIIWSFSSALCVPVLYANNLDVANTLMVSFLVVFYIFCSVITAIFICLKRVFDYNRSKINKIKAKKSSKMAKKDKHLWKSCVLITLCFYISWILFLASALSNSDEKIILLPIKDNNILQDVAVFLPYAFAALLPYFLLVVFIRLIGSSRKSKNQDTA